MLAYVNWYMPSNHGWPTWSAYSAGASLAGANLGGAENPAPSVTSQSMKAMQAGSARLGRSTTWVRPLGRKPKGATRRPALMSSATRGQAPILRICLAGNSDVNFKRSDSNYRHLRSHDTG